MRAILPPMNALTALKAVVRWGNLNAAAAELGASPRTGSLMAPARLALER